ncbi:baseplate assembly protein [Gracilibacillus xinjiangensis]|uniref:Baseplate J/gp47 family protein n=1 Tax=Gracilibacillus xinjiangensis TaxID=1193282 RepID=A0ABV8WWG4_9BACI
MKLTLTLKDLPEINFVNTDVNQILNETISSYEKAYFESTGIKKKLYPGDPIRIWLYSQALREFQLRVLIDDAAKQNLLKYARKDYLEHLGAFSNTGILKAKPATTNMKLILSKIIPTNEVVPAGTRVSPGNDIYFTVDDDVVIPAGNQEVTFSVTCAQFGTIGNGFTPGQINILVDPLPWGSSVENIDTSHGGSDEEDADSYRDRIQLAPEGFSVAGPEGAYKYFAKQHSALISDLQISSESPGEVNVSVLLQNGEIPNESFLVGLGTHLNDKNIRPLTDKVSVTAPEVINYDLNITYYIKTSDSGVESQVIEHVEKAIKDYIVWQRLKIGRDINPSHLISEVIKAEAKRVEVVSPVFASIGSNEVAIASSENITYGGLEDE